MNSGVVLKQFTDSFGSFSVEDLIYAGRKSRVLFSGPLRSAQSGIPLDDDPRMLFDYNQQLLELALELDPKSILVLGGGALTLPQALLGRLPDCQIVAVEINPNMVKIAAEFFSYEPNPRLKVVVEDAARFLSRAKAQRYELIITDLFDNLAIPQYFLSADFAAQLNRVRESSGLIATNCIAAISGNYARPLLELVASYETAIARPRVVRVDGDRFMNWTPQNLLILAGEKSDSVLPGLGAVSLS